MSKNAIQKSGVITFTWPLGYCTAKNEDIGLKFCTPVCNTYLYYIYSGFWISIKFWIFWAFNFEKNEILILRGQKPKILEIRDSHFVER